MVKLFRMKSWKKINAGWNERVLDREEIIGKMKSKSVKEF